MTGATVGPATSSGRWASVGWDDPAPGEPTDVLHLASHFQHKADDLRALVEEVRSGVIGLWTWYGSAADTFRRTHEELRRDFDEFIVQLERCAAALRTFADRLTGHRGEADVLLRRVEAAYRRRHAAGQASDGGLIDDVVAVGHQLAAEKDLAVLKVEHTVLVLRHRETVDATIGGLAVARGDGRFGALFGTVTDIASTVANAPLILRHEAGDFLRDNAELIAAAGDAAGDLGLIVGTVGAITTGVAAVFPPAAVVAAPLDTAALALGVVALGAHATAKASGSTGVDGGDIAWDIAGLAPAGKLGRLVGGTDEAGGVVQTGVQTMKEGGEALDHDDNAFSRLGENAEPDSAAERLVTRAAGALGHPEAASVPVLIFNYLEHGHDEDLAKRGVTAR